jgi:hypothetical protein
LPTVIARPLFVTSPVKVGICPDASVVPVVISAEDAGMLVPLTEVVEESAAGTCEAVKPVAFETLRVVGVPRDAPLGIVTVPVKVGEASGAAPRVLYESVIAADPLNVEPEAAPAPPLLRVRAFNTLPDDPVVFWLSVGIAAAAIVPPAPVSTIEFAPFDCVTGRPNVSAGYVPHRGT